MSVYTDLYGTHRSETVIVLIETVSVFLYILKLEDWRTHLA